MGQADALPILVGYLGDNLSGDIAGRGKAVGLLNPGLADNRAVLQHVLQVHQVAVVHAGQNNRSRNGKWMMPSLSASTMSWEGASSWSGPC